jgi:hypothetical protein
VKGAALKVQTNIQDWLVDWLCCSETVVSELWPLRACCSSPSDCDVYHGMMVLTGANS